MKESTKRITTGFLYVVALLIVLALRNPIVDSCFIVFISLIGIYEYNKAFKTKGYNIIPFIGYLSCFGIFFMGGSIDNSLKMNILRIMIPITLVIMFVYILIKKLEINIVDLALTAFSIIYVPFLFSFIKLLFLMPHGRILVILAFVCSAATDTFAYEIGSRFGKHKLSPIVSPKKSVEGSIAGVIGTVICCSILAYVTNTYFQTDFNIILMGIMGIIFSIVGQIGDLAASSIKRYCGVKDFSNLLPGHGGILDRFDSVMFISPMVYVFITLISML